MIDLYYWPTPNGHKISIFLEETATPYRVVPVNIRKGEQFAPDFLKISPNNRMPAIVDTDGPGAKPISIFESGAILLYLAEKTGKLMPSEMRARYGVIQWLMFQMAGVGPMFGQAGHFRNAAPEKIPYAIDRYTNETHRLCDVMNKRLGDRRYRHLSVGGRRPSARACGIGKPPQSQALGRRDRRASRGQEGHGRDGRYSPSSL